MAMDVRVRPAAPADVDEIVTLVRDLAEYERLADQVELTPDHLHRLLFAGPGGSPGRGTDSLSGAPAAYCDVAELPPGVAVPDGARLAGFALWFLNVSTFTGTHGIYLEDLYVRPECRGLGAGRSLLATLAARCVERGYRRFEWSVLDWNEPSIALYRRLGAVGMDDWTVQRVTGDALDALAAQAPPR